MAKRQQQQETEQATQTQQGRGAGRAKRWRLRHNHKGHQAGQSFGAKDVERLGFTDEELARHFDAVD